MRRLFGIALLVLGVSGCASVSQPQPMPLPGVAVGGAGGGAMAVFPECQTELVFAGETTLAALGLAEIAGGGPDATRPGMILVTAENAAFDVPEPAGGKGAVVLPAGQWVCVTWPDGSGMSTNVPQGWELPSDVGETAASDEPGALNLGPIAVVAAVVVLVGASIVAFRREAPA
jgi:hypothetical protein